MLITNMEERHGSESVDCIACGSTVDRTEAREYDRFGDRWERSGKKFEYLCDSCHDAESHAGRSELESTLEEIGSDHDSPEAFIAAYYRVVAEREEKQSDSQEG